MFSMKYIPDENNNAAGFISNCIFIQNNFSENCMNINNSNIETELIINDLYNNFITFPQPTKPPQENGASNFEIAIIIIGSSIAFIVVVVVVVLISVIVIKKKKIDRVEKAIVMNREIIKEFG